MRVRILGKVWEFAFDPSIHRDYHGFCDRPTTPNKRIRVRSTLRGQEQLATILHEMLHAADWHKDEEWVETVAEDLARALWRMGYRKEG